MNLSQAIAKNAAIQYTSKVIGTILGLFTIAILTRYLGAAGFGEYTVAASYLQFTGTLVDFGFTITAVRMLSVAGADREKIFGNIVTLRLVSALFVFAASALLALLLPWGASVHKAIAIGAFSFVLLSLYQVSVGLFQQSMKMQYPAVAEVAGRAGLLIGVIVVSAAGFGISGVMVAMGVGNLIMIAIALCSSRKITAWKLQLDRTTVRDIVKQSAPIAVSIMFNLIYLRGDIIVMKLVGRPAAEIGWYGAAYKPLDVITVIPIIFMGLVLPHFVDAWSKIDRTRVRRVMERAVDGVSLLAMPTLVGGMMLATPLMIFLSGNEFAPAGPLLAMLIVAAFMVFFGSLFGYLIVGINRQRTMTWFYALDAFVSLALYFIFIPRFGATAAAIVTIFSEALIAVAAGAIVVWQTKVFPSLNIFFRAAAAAAAMGIVLYFIPSLNVIIRVIFGASAYAVFAFLFGAVTQTEIKKLITNG
jgi:O-antigen/teichoic acid export membrane protein